LLILLWLIAMNVFHSPALSMLELYAPIEVMPGVAALLTVLSGLTAALEPSLTAIVDGLGAPLTFAAGGVAVALSGYAFFRTARTVEPPGVSHAKPAAQRTDLVLVLAMGLGLGLGEALMSDGLSGWISRHGALATNLSPAWQSSLLYAIAALVAWPLGVLGDRFGAEPLALAGASGGIVLAAAAWVLPMEGAKAAFCLFPVAYAALAVAALPVAFSRLLPGHKVLGVGVLFSGVELATGAVKIALAL
jgi:subtilisin family serine protease